MKFLIIFLLFILTLTTLIVHPAPISVDLGEMLLIILPLILAGFSLLITRSFIIFQLESNLVLASAIYLSYLLISFLIGLTSNIPILYALRAVGPYINFFPLILLAFIPNRFLSPKIIAWILFLVGLTQSFYHLYLFMTHSYGAGALNMLRARITVVDPRTTMPHFYAVAILPLLLLSHKNTTVKLLGMLLVTFGLFAGAATITRSIIISMVIGWLAYFIIYRNTIIHKQDLLTVTNQRPHFFKILFANRLVVIILLIIAGYFLNKIPKINSLIEILIARFDMQSQLTYQQDYSNGRLYEEWIPAIVQWVNSGPLNIFFGIGSGNPFIVLSGEERTYIHNLILYCLLYGGLYGLFACLFLYFTLLKTLIIRAWHSQQAIYVAFAAQLITLFFYGQLFAVHKGLAFNVILFLILLIALRKPSSELTENLSQVQSVKKGLL